MPDTKTDLATLWDTCSRMACEANAAWDLVAECGPISVSESLERIHRDLIDALAIVNRLEVDAAHTETPTQSGETQ